MTDTLFNHPEVLTIIVGLPLLGVIAKVFGQSFERIAKWYLYAAVFAVIIVMDSIFFPFIGGEGLVFPLRHRAFAHRDAFLVGL